MAPLARATPFLLLVAATVAQAATGAAPPAASPPGPRRRGPCCWRRTALAATWWRPGPRTARTLSAWAGRCSSPRRTPNRTTGRPCCPAGKAAVQMSRCRLPPDLAALAVKSHPFLALSSIGVAHLIGGAVHVAPAEAHEVRVARMGARAHAVVLRELHRPVHDLGVARVEAAGDVGRGDVADDLAVHAHRPGAEALSHVAVQVDCLHIRPSVTSSGWAGTERSPGTRSAAPRPGA